MGTKVFITADVVDIHSRTIDFSEVIEIDEKGNIPQFIDSFTTQIAGGSLEKWSYEALNPDQGEPSHIPHLWRSALIPGWGQLHKDSYFMAAFYNIAFIATAMNAKNKSNIYNSKLNEYNNYKLFMYSTLFGENKEQILQSPLLVEIKRNEVKSSAVNANTAVSLLVGIYIVNLIDAYIVPIRKNVPKVNVEVGSDMFFNNSYPPNKITGNVRWDISLEFKF
ncbi:MAG: hypothetical protein KDK36_08870 [Leptospiraceae bacterium]|nr:hypothetical protein [Leptospiraceae bacterium]